jgi:branched-chain amino acid transport system ATP-binding protein
MGALAAMTLLTTEGLSRHFGGVQAVNAVDFRLARGEIRAVIGPNGAGKTTLVNMICGRIPASAGRIIFEGADVTRLKPWNRVELGIVYTFQITSVFGNLTCFDNVALAVQRSRARKAEGQRWGVWGSGHGHLAREVEATLERVGLAPRGEVRAATLSYGHQRLLELAIGLALRPKLLILDEPTQGLAEDEIVSFCDLVRDIAKDATVLLIEHNMSVVMEVADRITVMNNGAILVEGRPAEIKADPEVQRAYLGA